MASNKALFALVRHAKANSAGVRRVPQRPDLGGLKQRLQQHVDAREYDPPPSFGAHPRSLDMSELRKLLEGARVGLAEAEQPVAELSEEANLRRELVALDRESLEIERERAKLASPWWVRLLRWVAAKLGES